MHASTTDILRGDKSGARRDNGVREMLPPQHSHYPRQILFEDPLCVDGALPGPSGPGPSRQRFKHVHRLPNARCSAK
jgi:hypothetical protein